MSNTGAWIVLAVAGVLLATTVTGWVAYMAARGRSPDMYAHYEHVLADMQACMERTDQRLDRLRAALDSEREYSDLLAETLRKAGIKPPPRPVLPPAVADSSGLADLSHKVAACFSVEEIDTLAFELGLAGALTGETLENRASSLVLAALRRDQLSQLVAIARRERPRGGF